jgi:hypothetical protein
MVHKQIYVDQDNFNEASMGIESAQRHSESEVGIA